MADADVLDQLLAQLVEAGFPGAVRPRRVRRERRRLQMVTHTELLEPVIPVGQLGWRPDANSHRTARGADVLWLTSGITASGQFLPLHNQGHDALTLDSWQPSTVVAALTAHARLHHVPVPPELTSR